MSHRYAPLPNPRSDELAQNEMEAAFDDSEDESDHNAAESQPLNPSSAVYPPRTSGTYDFENVDYDYPPPGSPPSPSSLAIPNSYGNSNGVIPSLPTDHATQGPERSWLRRTAASLLPHSVVQRIGLAPHRPVGIIGSGLNNDGVFANVTAKPSRSVQESYEDNMYLVPEDSRSDAPPSYAHAQADAVPQYWETTVHAPFSSDGIGEMIVDSLPTGTLFSFLWNMLISISFQFVGFLLTYLLHTTHAARLGSRAGLGITLIQYGFALREKSDSSSDSWTGWHTGDSSTGATPTMETAAEANEYYKNIHNGTSGFTDPQTSMGVTTAATEWLSFFLMTIGWFTLLTSLLGFWRVKHWERGIIASQRENAPPAAPATPQQPNSAILAHIESLFGLNGVSRSAMLREGFGLGSARADSREREYDRSENNDRLDLAERALIAVDSRDRGALLNIQATLRSELQLQEDLRAAGLI